jgi:hypothetical protein
MEKTTTKESAESTFLCMRVLTKKVSIHKKKIADRRIEHSKNDVPLHAVVKSSRETTSCGSDYNLACSR